MSANERHLLSEIERNLGKVKSNLCGVQDISAWKCLEHLMIAVKHLAELTEDDRAAKAEREAVAA